MNGDIVKLLHNWIRADRYDILQDGSDNTVYLVYRGNEKYILRQSKKLKKKKDFEFEINFYQSIIFLFLKLFETIKVPPLHIIMMSLIVYFLFVAGINFVLIKSTLRRFP